jgi:hypothetical protein
VSLQTLLLLLLLLLLPVVRLPMQWLTLRLLLLLPAYCCQC